MRLGWVTRLGRLEVTLIAILVPAGSICLFVCSILSYLWTPSLKYLGELLLKVGVQDIPVKAGCTGLEQGLEQL